MNKRELATNVISTYIKPRTDILDTGGSQKHDIHVQKAGASQHHMLFAKKGIKVPCPPRVH
jgi:hypothetical protein